MRELFHDPRHPHKRGLLGSIPGGAHGGRLQAIPGTVPSLGHMPPGCSFHPRCSHRFEPCDKAAPGVTLIESRYPMTDARAHVPETDIGHRTSDIGTVAARTARCYLYSPAADPDVLPEVKR